MSWVRYLAKAIFAGVVAFTGTTAAALMAVGDGAAFSELSAAVWLTIVGTTAIAVGGVYGFTNGPKP